MPRQRYCHNKQQQKHATQDSLAVSTASVSKPLTKSQRREAMARKKDERSARKKERRKATATTTSDVVGTDDKSFAAQLEVMGLKVREVIGDGNCLFRALADQLDGDDHSHARHRQDVVRYINEHRADFEPFIEDDVPFTQHVQNLAQDGTYAGNDSIVAFARLHKLTVVIHQLDSPAWEVHGQAVVDGTSSGKVALPVVATPRQLHISYHNGDHYASVRRMQDKFDGGPANVHISSQVPTSPCQSATTDQHRKTQHRAGTENASFIFLYHLLLCGHPIVIGHIMHLAHLLSICLVT